MAMERSPVIVDDSDRREKRREEEREGKGKKEDRKATDVLLGPKERGLKASNKNVTFLLLAYLHSC